jgi:hypothetical protein
MNLPETTANNTELARKCLERIRDIADRSASSWDPSTVGWALQELSQVFVERLGIQERFFEPVTPNEIHDLPALCEELDWVDGFSQEFSAPHRCN